MPLSYLESTMLPNTITTHFDLAAGLINRPAATQRTEGIRGSPQKTQYSSFNQTSMTSRTDRSAGNAPNTQRSTESHPETDRVQQLSFRSNNLDTQRSNQTKQDPQLREVVWQDDTYMLDQEMKEFVHNSSKIDSVLLDFHNARKEKKSAED